MAAKPKAKVKVTKKPAGPLGARVAKDPALLKRALADPGLRSKLPDKFLTGPQRENRRLNQPAIPGSSLTNRQVETQTQAATDLQFGPNARPKLEQQNRDVAGWYEQYKQDLARHAQNLGQINRDTAGSIQGLSAGIRGIGEKALGEQQQREADQSRVTGATAADLSKTASDASQVRQAMIAALGSAEAGRGGARQSYADTLANVVGPGYGLQAGAQGQQRLRDLDTQTGAFKTEARRKLIEDARKQALEEAVFGADLAKTAADADAKAKEVNQYGYTTAEWQQMTPAERLRAQREQKKATTLPKSRNPNANPGDHYGYTNAEWAKLSTEQRRRIVADAKKQGSANKAQWLPRAGQNAAKDKIDSAVTLAKSLRADDRSQAEVRQLLLSGRAAQTIDGVKFPAIPKINKRWVNVAMDIIYKGYISPANVNALQVAGIKVKPLGYRTPGTKPKVKTLKDIVGLTGSGKVDVG